MFWYMRWNYSWHMRWDIKIPPEVRGGSYKWTEINKANVWSCHLNNFCNWSINRLDIERKVCKHLLPPAYVVRREGNVLTRVCPSVCPQGGVPISHNALQHFRECHGQPLGGGYPARSSWGGPSWGVPSWGGPCQVQLGGVPSWGDPARSSWGGTLPGPAGGVPSWGGYPAGGYPARSSWGGTQPGGVPCWGVPCRGGRYPVRTT